jgi:hypothetical protein
METKANIWTLKHNFFLNTHLYLHKYRVFSKLARSLYHEVLQGVSEISLEKKCGVSLTQNNFAKMTFGGEIKRMEITLYPCTVRNKMIYI